jgi:hypothetical protein
MNHDFVDDNNQSGSRTPRFDTKNKSCLGQGGIMDYAKTDENDKSCWSTCSIEDFTIQMNENKTCLSIIDPKNPPKNPASPLLTKDECDLSKIYPGLSGVHTLYLNGNYKFFLYILGVGRVPQPSIKITYYNSFAAQNK